MSGYFDRHSTWITVRQGMDNLTDHLRVGGDYPHEMGALHDMLRAAVQLAGEIAKVIEHEK